MAQSRVVSGGSRGEVSGLGSNNEKTKPRSYIMPTVAKFLKHHNACQEGYKWAVQNCKTMEEVWETCKPEWLVWLATRPGVLPEKDLHNFSWWVASQVKHLMLDHRSLAALDAKRAWVDGKITDAELATAWEAAWAAAGAAAWAAGAAGGAGAAGAAAWAAREAAEAAGAAGAAGAAREAARAAWAAAGAAAWAVWEAARAAGEAAREAAGAVGAAGEAAEAAGEAAEAARAAAWDAQAQYIRGSFQPTFLLTRDKK